LYNGEGSRQIRSTGALDAETLTALDAGSKADQMLVLLPEKKTAVVMVIAPPNKKKIHPAASTLAWSGHAATSTSLLTSHPLVGRVRWQGLREDWRLWSLCRIYVPLSMVYLAPVNSTIPHHPPPGLE